MIDKICNNCGTRLSEFYNTGMLGCPYCYKAFEKEIMPTLYKIQGKTYHVGKTPNVSSFDDDLLAEYQRLIIEKERANREGRFTEVRMLDEQLNALYNELKNRGIL